MEELSPLELLVAYLEKVQKRFEDLTYLDLYRMSVRTRRFVYQIMDEDTQAIVKTDTQTHIIYTQTCIKLGHQNGFNRDCDNYISSDELRRMYSRMNGMRNMYTQLSEWYQLPVEVEE